MILKYFIVMGCALYTSLKIPEQMDTARKALANIKGGSDE